MTEQEIQERLARLLADLSDAEQKSGRASGSVKLCAVSKFHSADDVVAAMGAGQLLFGENRVQEAYAKFTQIGALVDEGSLPRKPELHIIGSLQLNKVKKAVEIASCIQSVDREELLREIEKRCAALGKKMRVLFEIHTGEESKAGYTDEKAFFSSLENCASNAYPHIEPLGLMTMAALSEDESLVRKSFSSLRSLQERASKAFPTLSLTELSMGMSGDYRIAVEEGSTMVRVGTAIFGPRTL